MDTLQKAGNSLRIGLGVFGLLAVLAGIAIMVLPGKTAVVVTAIFAVYAIVAGIVYVGVGLFSGAVGVWARLWRILLGVLIVISGIFGLANLQETAGVFFVFMSVFIGISWIFEGVMTFASLGGASSKGTSIMFGILSIVAGFVLVYSPLAGAAALWWAIGLSAIIYGAAEMIVAFRAG